MRVEFHFDFGSPNAYLSHVVIPGIEQRTGAKFVYVPILLGGMLRSSGRSVCVRRLSSAKPMIFEFWRSKSGM